MWINDFSKNWNVLTHLSPTFPVPNFTYFHSTVVVLLYAKRCGGDIRHILAIFSSRRHRLCSLLLWHTLPWQSSFDNDQPQTGPTEIVAQSCFSFSFRSHFCQSPLHYSPLPSVVAPSLVKITSSYSLVGLPRLIQQFTAFWVVRSLTFRRLMPTIVDVPHR